MAESPGFLRRMTGLGPTRRNTDSIDDVRGSIGLDCVRDVDDPLVEFIFVHSLPGSTRRTWSFNVDIATFWPQEWLKEDSAFDHVRVHTFGYETQSQVRLNVGIVKDTGKLLLKELEGSSRLRKTKISPIVFIGHSLGGLVIKQALNEATRNPKYRETYDRFHSVLFLGTPHRGIDLTMVTDIVRACSSEWRTPDIEPDVTMLEEINQQFDRNDHPVRKFCFYEMQPTLPQARSVVVDRFNATLDQAEDIRQTCNHPGLAKFEDSGDLSYQYLRNSLADVVKEVTDEHVNPEKVFQQLERLQYALGVTADEYLELQEYQEVEGTCNWLVDDPEFKRWRDASLQTSRQQYIASRRSPTRTMNTYDRASSATPPQIYWLTGPPGCGKTILSAFAIRHIQELQRPCSFYFLKHTDRSRQNLGGLLRSLAYQMASADPVLRRLLVAMNDEGSLTAEHSSIQPLWNQIFTTRIFRANCTQRQYWIIDSLDEGIGGQELLTLLSRIPKTFPLSIFITTRGDFQMSRLSRSTTLYHKQISAEDTAEDIRTLLHEESEYLNVDDIDKGELMAELANRSRGSFLWVRLVLERLTRVYAKEEIAKVLDEIPEDMNLLYEQILEEMQERRHINRELTQAILRWTICASRPLTIDELREAILRDTKHDVPKMERMIQDICGQLVVVDKAGRVQLVHETARDFLLNPRLQSVFAVRKAASHGRLAEVCLRYLLEVEGRPLHQRGIHGARTGRQAAIDEYAHLYFSEHVVRDNRADTDIPGSLEEFFDTTVLQWVEYVAHRKDLTVLTQTAKNLKAWIDIRSNFQAPTTTEKLISMWAMDLIRLVTVFGKDLVNDPRCVHTVIAPLSPKVSAIHERYGISPIGMEVVGLSARGWAERIFSAPFTEDWTNAVATSETHYGVGLRSGSIVLFSSFTCQQIGRLTHGEPITHMKFSGANEWLVVCGKTTLSLWNYQNAEKQWQCQVSSDPLALGFFELDSIIILLTRDGHVVEHSTANGQVIRRQSWHVDHETGRHRRPPMRAYLSSELNMAALVYKGDPLLLLDLGTVSRPRSIDARSTISAFTFNGHLKMIALSFMDGETAVYQLSTLHKECSITSHASQLVASPDGKSLLACNNFGQIQIHEFETLNLLSTLSLHDEAVRYIAFAPNSLRFVDVRYREFNVWEPAALVRRKDTDRSSHTSQGHTVFSSAVSNVINPDTGSLSSPISAMVAHDSVRYIFCGKDDGSICVYELDRGRFRSSLYKHGKVPISFLDWNPAKKILVSSDNRRIMAHRVQMVPERQSRGATMQWSAQRLWDYEIDSPIRQVLNSIDGEYLLMSNGVADHLLTLGQEEVFVHSCEHPETARTTSQKWAMHTQHPHRMFEIEPYGVHCLDWSNRELVKPTLKQMPIREDDRIDAEVRDSKVSFIGFGENLWAAFDDDPTTRPILWALQAGDNSRSQHQEVRRNYDQAAPEIQSLLGLYGRQLVFVNYSGWVCSIRIDETGPSALSCHFPIPHCWQSTSRRAVRIVTQLGDVVFAKGDELAVVKRGLRQ